jgi:DNA-binding protein HU-beta
MNKKDCVDIVNEKTGISKKDVNLIIDCFIEEIINTLIRGEKVMISNFGTFEKSTTKPIDVYSPHDGKLLKNVPQIRVRFKSSTFLKTKLKNNQF